jgi:hypothetical protein
MTRRFTGSRTHPELYLHRAQFQDTSRLRCMNLNGRPTPDPLARQTHRPKTKPVDQKIAAQQKCFLAAARLPRRSQAKVGARRRDNFL